MVAVVEIVLVLRERWEDKALSLQVKHSKAPTR
jgi:hypothetical protein